MTLLLHALAFAPLALAQHLRLNFQISNFEIDDIKNWDSLQARNIELTVYNELPRQRYLVNITVGTPPQPYSVLLDTGSADLWLPHPDSPGCAPDCPPGTFDPADSTTAVDIELPYNVSFGLTPENVMLGEYYNDTVSIGGVVLEEQSFAVAKVPAVLVQGGLWGIMGMGSLLGTSAFNNQWGPVYHNASASPAPVWLNLYEKGYVEKKLFSVWLDDQDAKTGTILLGGIDNSKYDGELKSTPVLTYEPERLFIEWAVTLNSVARVDGESGESEQLTSGNWSIRTIIDTGAPNMYLPTAVFNSIVAPWSVTWHPTANTPYVPCSLRSSSLSIEFSFPGREGQDGPTVRVPYRESIYPFGLPLNPGELRDEDGTELCYLGIIPNEGPIFLIGAPLIRNAYTVFDAEALEIKMAPVKSGYGVRF